MLTAIGVACFEEITVLTVYNSSNEGALRIHIASKAILR